MPALETPDVNIGWKAPGFLLKGVDGKSYSLKDVQGANGLVVMFICNHCPYVKAVIDRVVKDANELKAVGIGSIAIMSNDTKTYPEDSFEKMQQFSQERRLTFPYVIDEAQVVASAYGAVCTPDFFGFNGKLELQYRGRLDESWQLVIPNPKRELLLAMKEVAKTGKTTAAQAPSIGCSIKWRKEAA